MRKCISAIAATTSLIACVATAVPASAAEATSCEFIFSVDADSVQSIGDVINVTLSVKANGTLYGLQGYLSLPDGLEFVSGSEAVASGAKDTLVWDDLSVTDQTDKGAGEILLFSGYGATPADNANKEIKIATFQVKVTKTDVNAEITLKKGSTLFGLKDNDAGECDDVSVTGATVKGVVASSSSSSSSSTPASSSSSSSSAPASSSSSSSSSPASSSSSSSSTPASSSNSSSTSSSTPASSDSTSSSTTPASSDTDSGSGSGSGSDNVDTGVPGIAMMIGLVTLAGATVVVSRKRK